MCYAIPGKLISLKDNIGVVDYFGEERKILVDKGEATVGDYVIAQGGVLVRKIPESQAEQILVDWKESFEKLKERDASLTSAPDVTGDTKFLQILQKANLKQTLSKEELLFLLQTTDKKQLQLLYDFANTMRQKEHGNASCTHAILEFSNNCVFDCEYCGIRKSHDLKRYRLTTEEIVARAKYGVEQLGFTAFVLQSGEDFSYTDEQLVDIVKQVKSLGVLVFLSLGLRSKALYKKLYDAGARAVLLRFETSDEQLFSKLRPGTTLKDRLSLIKYLKEIGYVLATGFMYGLPGETDETIINNILLNADLAPDMYSSGPLIPTKGTPLKEEELISADTALKIIAITRLVSSDSNILVTTALETLEPQARKQGLLAGANSLMLTLTPPEVKALYAIYDGKANKEDRLLEQIQETIELLKSLGRSPMDIGLIQ